MYAPRSDKFSFRFTTAAQNTISNSNFQERLLYLLHQPQTQIMLSTWLQISRNTFWKHLPMITFTDYCPNTHQEPQENLSYLSFVKCITVNYKTVAMTQ